MIAENYKKRMLSYLNSNNKHGVQNLLENGFPVNIPLAGDGFTALHHAAKKGQIDMIELLLKWQADIDIVDDVEKWTPLMLSCLNGKLGAVDILLQKNASAVQVSEDGNTALDFLKREASNFEGKPEDEEKYKALLERLANAMHSQKKEETAHND